MSAFEKLHVDARMIEGVNTEILGITWLRPSLPPDPAGGRDAADQSQWLVDLEALENNDNCLVLAVIGRLHPIKRVDQLIRALGTIDSTHIFCVVAGTGEPEYVGQLRQEVANANLGERIRFVGHLSEAEKWALLKRANLLVHPSSHENLGVAILEALGAGVPVLLSDKTAQSDRIAREGLGMVYDGTYEGLAEALARLVSQPGTLAEMRTRLISYPAASPVEFDASVAGLYARYAGHGA